MKFTLTNVTSSTSQVLPTAEVSVNMLIGDATADKAVSNSDVRLTKGQVGLPVTGANFREDLNISGSISNTDVRLVKSNLGHTLS